MTVSLATADAGQAPGRGEFRVSERISCDVPASCQPPSDWKRGGQKWVARVRDVSSGGLCLVLNRRFERGAGLAIELPGADPDSPSTLLARVMNVRAEGGGAWALGCAFISPLSDEELEALTRTAGADAPPDQPPSAEAGVVADVRLRATLPGGGIVERRIRKLNVESGWPLAPGRLIGLCFRGDEGDLRTARVRVDGCRSPDGRWVLECTFVGAPPPELR